MGQETSHFLGLAQGEQEMKAKDPTEARAGWIIWHQHHLTSLQKTEKLRVWFGPSKTKAEMTKALISRMLFPVPSSWAIIKKQISRKRAAACNPEQYHSGRWLDSGAAFPSVSWAEDPPELARRLQGEVSSSPQLILPLPIKYYCCSSFPDALFIEH